MAKRWRIFYSDGSQVDSSECLPENVPGYGVEAIALPDRSGPGNNVGYLVLRYFDWYYWRKDTEEWDGAMGDTSIWDLILHRLPITGICQGRKVSDKRFEKILGQAEKWAKEASVRKKISTRRGEAPY